MAFNDDLQLANVVYYRLNIDALQCSIDDDYYEQKLSSYCIICREASPVDEIA